MAKKNVFVSFDLEHQNNLVGVNLDRSYESPDGLLGNGASWATSFSKDTILKAFDEASCK